MRPFSRSFALAALASISLALASLPDAAAKPKTSESDSGPGKSAKAGDSKNDKSDKDKSDKDKGDKDKGKSKKKSGPLSSGSPNRGHLDGGIRLKGSGHVKVRGGARAWGLPTLTKLIHRVANRVASRHGGSVLLVGDLSAKNGGQIDGHHSHQSGRDADVGFYVANSKGKPVDVSKFIAFDAEGHSKNGPNWARFDELRNWMLVEELLKDEKAPVRYVFVANHLRARLLKYAASKKVPKDLYDRAAAAMLSPDGADVHDNHFHVRIACPESMRADCVEESGAREQKLDAVADAAPDVAGASADRKSGSPAGDTSRPSPGGDPY